MSPANDGFHILLVEDNPGDIDLVKVALEDFDTPHSLHVTPDGALALAYLLGDAAAPGPRPDLILLDLNVPRVDGREVLAAIKSDPRTLSIPVIVLTSSSAERDLVQAYELHANCFLTKPSEIDAFFNMFRQIEEFWLKLVKLPPAPEPLLP